MKNFQYSAIDNKGMIQKGRYECNSIKELITYLYSKDQYLIKTSQEKMEVNFRFSKKIRAKEVSLFCRQVGTMLEVGIPIIDAIQLTGIQLKKGKLYENCCHVTSVLKGGGSLQEAMKGCPNRFPEFIVHMMQIGEKFGNIEGMFKSLSNHYYKEFKLVNKVTGAIAYPLFVLVFTLVAAIVLMTTLIPSMMGIIVGYGGELPLITTIIMNTSIFFKSNLIYIFAGIIILIIVLISLKKKNIIDTSYIKRKTPLLNKIYFKIIGYRYLSSVYLMLYGGCGIVDAMEGATSILRDPYLIVQTKNAVRNIREGSSIINAIIGMEIIDITSLSIIRLGEETGKLQEMLKRLLVIMDDEINSLLDKILELIQPVSILFVGSIVGTIVISVALPMFSMYEM